MASSLASLIMSKGRLQSLVHCAALLVVCIADSSFAQESQSYLSRADAARMDNEEKIRTAQGSGGLTMVLESAGNAAPLELTDAQIQVHYDSPKFLITVQNRRRLREIPIADRINDQRWYQADVAKEAVLFDGDSLVVVNWDLAGNCSGEVYFAFSRQAVLRAAGFPFEHPVFVWRESLNLSRVKAKQTKITPFRSGGFRAVEKSSSYDTKFFVFNRFGYDLRRVSTQRTDNGLPIREYSMKWDESEGVFFLEMFANTVTKTRLNPITDEHEVVSRHTTKVTYDSFEINQPLAEDQFHLAGLGIPTGTLFIDKRRRNGHKDAVLQFDGQSLVPAEVQ